MRTSDRRYTMHDTQLKLAKKEYTPYASASPDDSYNCELVHNNGGSSLQIALTQRTCDSHLTSLGFRIFSSRKIRTAWTPFNVSALWGENKTSKRWSWLETTTSLSSSLMQLQELKRAVTCDKNSGCRLYEQMSSEFSNEL